MTIELGPAETAFAEGGNRLCFIDPNNPERCIKVLRPDRSPAIRRAQKKFPKNLRPLNRFDDNREEFRVMRRVDRYIGEQAYELVSRCFGFVQTNYGPGLASELIIDANKLISISLKQYLWQFGKTEDIMETIQLFSRRWNELGMPSRDLLLHNIVVQQAENHIQRLVVIDGLGWAGMATLAYYLPSLARSKAKRKTLSLYRHIDALMEKKSGQLNYGYHGWLDDQKRKLT